MIAPERSTDRTPVNLGLVTVQEYPGRGAAWSCRLCGAGCAPGCYSLRVTRAEAREHLRLRCPRAADHHVTETYVTWTAGDGLYAGQVRSLSGQPHRWARCSCRRWIAAAHSRPQARADARQHRDAAHTAVLASTNHLTAYIRGEEETGG